MANRQLPQQRWQDSLFIVARISSLVAREAGGPWLVTRDPQERRGRAA